MFRVYGSRFPPWTEIAILDFGGLGKAFVQDRTGTCRVEVFRVLQIGGLRKCSFEMFGADRYYLVRGKA